MAGTVFRRPEDDRGPLDILIDVAHTFVVDVYEDDLPKTCSSATVQILKPSGEDLLASTAVTPVAGLDGSTTNRLSYTLASGSIDTLGIGYMVIWTAVTGTGTFVHRVLFDICTTVPTNTVREEDLFEYAPTLRDNRVLAIEEGTADSGSTTTLVDARLKQYPDDLYNGGLLEIIDGTNEGEQREVTDFARSTGTVTVGVAFASAVDTTTVYRLRRSWRVLIARAFEEVRWRLRMRGLRPALIVDSYELHQPTLLLAVALAFESDPRNGPEGDNWRMAREYRQKFDAWWSAASFNYDTDEDGDPDATTLQMGVVQATRY